MTTSRIALSAEWRALIERGVSVLVGSHDAALRPSLMRAVGSDWDAGTGSVVVYLARRQSVQLLADLEATGRIAVVFSEPSTHRTLQLKARQVDMRAANDADRPVLARYLASMEHEIQQVGYAPPLTRAMLAHEVDDVVAVRFVPEEAFDQTPGPKAGSALGEAP